MSILRNMPQTSFDVKTKCCGCEACVQICSKRAITMYEDEEGFRYPLVNSETCNNCGACENVCQYIVPAKKKTEVQHAFGGHIKNKETLNESTSGGAFSAIVEIWCDENYVIFGAETEGLKVWHSYIEDKKELNKFRRSKYSQSIIGNSFIEVRRFLKEGKKVVFSGTPCQIAGLKSFLNDKEYKGQLLTIEVVCEGVPTPFYIRKMNESYVNSGKGEIAHLDYRYKDTDKWDFQVMKVKTLLSRAKNPVFKTFKYDRWFNPFWSIWLQHLMSRPSCYTCLYTTRDRVADITLGDLWGVHIYCPDLYNSNKGASLIVTNTEMGYKIVNQALSHNFSGRELPFDQALKYQGPMRKSISMNPLRESFMNDLKVMDYHMICKKWAVKPSFKLLISKYIYKTNRQVVWWWNLKKSLK